MNHKISSGLQDSYEARYLSLLKQRIAERQTLAADQVSFVFLHPPDATSHPINVSSAPLSREVNTGPFALKYDVAQNTAVILYEEWLLDNLIYTSSLKTNRSVEVRVRAMARSADLEDALAEVEFWKRTNWESQRVELSEKENSGGASSEERHVVDTGTWYCT